MIKNKQKLTLQRLFIFFALIILIGLIFVFFSNIFIPFIKLELAKDFNGAKELLLSKGVLGYISIPLVEGLQMVVVFISAEFIQITSGMSYPWWLAIILCDLGVCVGSSIIYLLVNVFKFDEPLFTNNRKVKKYERLSKNASSMLIMYLLFIMPIVPFGAICYYGSSKKIPYLKYLFTCSTGAIPSIITSILMGKAIMKFIRDSLPLWALLLIIVLLAALLFTALVLVFKKFFNPSNNIPQNPVFMAIVEKLSNLFGFFSSKIKVTGKEKLSNIDAPFIALANHHSVLDVFSLSRVFKNTDPIAVLNEYYLRLPVIGKILKKAGHIKKKLFYSDTSCIKNIMKAVSNGYSVFIFPEGRLTTDGGASYINKATASLCKKLNVPIVLIEIRNNYFLNPKWRKKRFRGTTEIEIKRVIDQNELDKIDKTELYNAICDNLSYNEFSNTDICIKNKGKAIGLENILYMCPNCGSMYSNISDNNTLKCTCCNKEYTIKDNYQFDDNEIKNIYEYYSKIKEYEKARLDNISFELNVDVKIFRDGDKKYRKEEGIFSFTNEKITFKSNISDLLIEYNPHDLMGIPYSVNEEFEFYYKDELYYFYPKDNRKICTRIALVHELLKENDYET